MKFKRIIALLTSAVVLGTSTISASAVLYDKTNTYYVYQQETYGEVTWYPNYALGNTYCELASTQKMTQAIFYYKNIGNTMTVGVASPRSDEYKNNKECNLYNYSPSVSDFDMSVGAMTKSGVKVTSYITWTSDGCEDNAQVGTF